jgi:hypothetical protein
VEQVVVEQVVELEAGTAGTANTGGGGGGGAWSCGTPGTGAAGGSGIVIVKELNKASGSWPLRAQFSSRNRERGLN